jgi:hypothetical protein
MTKQSNLTEKIIFTTVFAIGIVLLFSIIDILALVVGYLFNELFTLLT